MNNFLTNWKFYTAQFATRIRAFYNGKSMIKVLSACAASAAVIGATYFSRYWPHRSSQPEPTPTEVTMTANPSPAQSPTPTPIQPTPTPIPDVKWGAYVGWQEGSLSQFEKMVGKEVDIVADFVHWGNEKDFPMEYTTLARDKGKTLLIYWNAKDYNFDGPNDPRFGYDAILAGNWDSYITQFAADAKAYNGPVILIPFEEMNDNVAPWDGTVNNNSPEKHIQAYRKIREMFRTTAPNVKFGWAPNNVSVPDIPGNQITDYYPGDQYVDIVGVDGFNFGEPWTDFEKVFRPSLNILMQYKKPIYLFSMASRDGAKKAEWITEGLGNIDQYPVWAWVWFNENKSENGEYDWRVNSDPASLEAFKSVIPE